MTPFPSKFRHSLLIDSLKRFANHESFRGNVLKIGLLSSSLWLATPASSIAFLSPRQLEPQFTGTLYLEADPNTDEAPPRNLEKRIKQLDGKRLNSVNSLDSLSAQSFLLSQSSSGPEESDAFAGEIDASAAMEQPLDSSSEESGPINSGADPPTDTGRSLDLSPELIESSPVLQRWLEEVPDLISDIAHDPSFRTRLRAGYSEFPSTDQIRGVNVGIEDVFVGRTGLTVSGDYHRNGEGDRQSYGVELRYYLLSLGSHLNVAPVVGYRYLQTGSFNTDGINLGIKLLVSPSRTGAADISLTQTWVSPTSSEEVSITTFSLGYAMTRNLRISTDIQAQNSPFRYDSRVGISLEWML